MALGELIIPDEKGKVIGVRVLPAEGGGLNRIELTFSTTGTILGVGFQNTGTVTSSLVAGGHFHSEGQGVAITADGEPVSWRFLGAGTPTGPNLAGKFRGVVTFTTPSSKLARLNGTAAVVEAETDAQQNMHAKLWDWR